MRIIIQEYGVAVAALLTAGLILGLILGKAGVMAGVTNVLAKDAGIAPSHEEYEDAAVYRSLSERKRPVITYVGNNVAAGVIIDWLELFEAVDAEQNLLPVTVTAVNKNTEVPKNYCFEKRGIYEVAVNVTDTYGLAVQQTFRIPVQDSIQRREEAH